MVPVGVHQRGVEGEDDAHDDDVTRHHEDAPHEHAQGVGEGHENPELFAARQDEEHCGDQLHRADEGEQEFGLEHGQHKGSGFRLGVARGHDGGVGHVDVVEVLEA